MKPAATREKSSLRRFPDHQNSTSAPAGVPPPGPPGISPRFRSSARHDGLGGFGLRRGDCEAVPAFELGVIGRRIGLLDPGAHVAGVRPHLGKPDAERAAQAGLLESPRWRLRRGCVRPRPLRSRGPPRATRHRIRRRRSARPDRRREAAPDDRADAPNDLVADQVAMVIVDPLEVVDVDQQQGGRPALRAMPRQLALPGKNASVSAPLPEAAPQDLAADPLAHLPMHRPKPGRLPAPLKRREPSPGQLI